MKNLVMIAIALGTLNAAAQDIKKETPRKETIEMRQNMTPEEIAQLQTKKMTLNLDLTTAQQTEVQTIFLAQAKENKTKKEAFKAKKDSGSEKLTKDERLKIKNERLDQQIAMKQKLKTILNADQYAKFESMHQKRGRGNVKKRGMKPNEE